MAYKDKAKQRFFDRTWRRRQRIVNRLAAIEKLGGKCIDCGLGDVRVLEFDHIEPILQDKHNSYKLIRDILDGRLTNLEIGLRCSNCHMIKTYDDRLKFANFIMDQ